MKKIYFIFLLIPITGCLEKYNAPIKTTQTSYLVVEGFINIGQDSTDIMLSRTTPLDTLSILPELYAQVSVEGDNNSSYLLAEQGNGLYSAPQINLNPNQKYRIDIKTKDGNEYLSDFTEVKTTPAIDSVGWIADDNGATIYVSTHDPQNNTIYYQWNFEETWKYHSKYNSILQYDNNGGIAMRDPADQIFDCWKSDKSANILVASSEKLSSDIIYQNPINNITFAGSDKLFLQYSILVKQHAITKTAYEYFSEMKKNTEQLGSIFDAQPSQLTGNIHCITDSTQPVIGYITAASETEKRIFISRSQLPSDAIVFNGYEGCEPDTLNYPASAQQIQSTFANYFYVPSDYWYVNGFVAGIIYSDAECVDCREHGGTTQKPSFWP